MTTFSTVNPFYRASQRPSFGVHSQQPSRATYARLPRAPLNGSPVPHLTSLYHFDRAGNYGSRSYPGNCGGNLIKDLLLFFQPTSVFDPMSGSGTCADVCRELAIACTSRDLKSGFDATDPKAYIQFANKPKFDFIWAHPPYWRQKIYSDNPNDLSNASTVAKFRADYAKFITECVALLSPNGKFAILMGDYTDFNAGFIPLTHYTKQIAFESGLQQLCTDIVRFIHGAKGGRRTYRSSFIPILHDVCIVFEKMPMR